MVEDRDVVGFADCRFAERDREYPVAEGQSAAAGFDVHDDVAVGEYPFDRCSTASAAACPSTPLGPVGSSTTTSAK